MLEYLKEKLDFFSDFLMWLLEFFGEKLFVPKYVIGSMIIGAFIGIYLGVNIWGVLIFSALFPITILSMFMTIWFSLLCLTLLNIALLEKRLKAYLTLLFLIIIFATIVA